MTEFRVRSAVVALTVTMLFTGCGGGDGSSRIVIQNKGSDTLVNVAQAWAEEYAKATAATAVAVSGGGSGTGISAMINGTVDIANSSRRMTASELEQARANGHDPIEYIVGYDALAVFLHEDNPLEAMSLDQLADIYGEGGSTQRWSQLGAAPPGCPSDKIVRVSRQNNSGTYFYYRDAILGDRRDFKLGSLDMHGSKDVVDLVEHTPCAIGYSGLAYATEYVGMPCIRSAEDADCVEPTVATAIDRSYPISRPLFMYTAGEPQGAIREYLDWVLGDVGQCILHQKGYAPRVVLDCS